MARQSKASGSKTSRARQLPVEEISEGASSEDELDLEDMPEMEDEDEEEEGVAQWAPDDWDEAGDGNSASNSDVSEDDQEDNGDDLVSPLSC